MKKSSHIFEATPNYLSASIQLKSKKILKDAFKHHFETKGLLIASSVIAYFFEKIHKCLISTLILTIKETKKKLFQKRLKGLVNFRVLKKGWLSLYYTDMAK